MYILTYKNACDTIIIYLLKEESFMKKRLTKRIFSAVLATLLAVPAAIIPASVSAASDSLVISMADKATADKNLSMFESGYNNKMAGVYSFDSKEKALSLDNAGDNQCGGAYRFTVRLEQKGMLGADQSWMVVKYKTNLTKKAELQFYDFNSSRLILAEDASVSKGEWVFSNPVNIKNTPPAGKLSIYERLYQHSWDIIVLATQEKNVKFYISEIAFFSSAEDASAYAGGKEVAPSTPAPAPAPAAPASESAVAVSLADLASATKQLAIYTTSYIKSTDHSFGENVGNYKFNDTEKALEILKSSNNYMGGVYRFHVKANSGVIAPEQSWMVVNYKTNATAKAEMILASNAANDTAVLASDVSVSKGEYVFTKPVNLNANPVSGNLFTRLKNSTHSALVVKLPENTPSSTYFYIKNIYFFSSEAAANTFIEHGVLPTENKTADTTIGTGSFVGGSYNDGETTIATSLYVPKNYSADKEYSLLIYFHNVGNRGEVPLYSSGMGNALMRNVISLTGDNTIIFAPRCPTAYYWAEQPYAPGYYSFEDTPISKPMKAVISCIYDEIFEKYNIDKTRVWAFGDSLGGGGTWDLILREPGLLAGAVPTCGYCDPTQAVNVSEQTAIWAHHTMQDKSVNVRGDRAMTAALANLGRNVKYTEYDSSNPDHKKLFNGAWNSSTNWEHWTWEPTYNDKSVAEWLVAQKRTTAGEKTAETKFTDITPEDSFYKAVCYANEAKLFQGTSETTFSPDGVMTRAMFVTVLGRLAGVNTADYQDVTFTDVVAGSWYAPYVEWAAANGVVNGLGDGTFGINGDITVEQACTILGRYAEHKAAPNSTKLTLDVYPDAFAAHDWAKEGLTWAVDNGIYLGILGEKSELNPRDAATRALVAEMFYMYNAVYN